MKNTAGKRKPKQQKGAFPPLLAALAVLTAAAGSGSAVAKLVKDSKEAKNAGRRRKK